MRWLRAWLRRNWMVLVIGVNALVNVLPGHTSGWLGKTGIFWTLGVLPVASLVQTRITKRERDHVLSAVRQHLRSEESCYHEDLVVAKHHYEELSEDVVASCTRLEKPIFTKRNALTLAIREPRDLLRVLSNPEGWTEDQVPHLEEEDDRAILKACEDARQRHGAVKLLGGGRRWTALREILEKYRETRADCLEYLALEDDPDRYTSRAVADLLPSLEGEDRVKALSLLSDTRRGVHLRGRRELLRPIVREIKGTTFADTVRDAARVAIAVNEDDGQRALAECKAELNEAPKWKQKIIAEALGKDAGRYE